MSFSSKQEVLDSISKFEGLYNVVRIVDPVKKSVEGDSGTTMHTHCYDFWEKGTPCENCVTLRALIENDTFYKMEFKKGKIYLVTSCPVQVKENTYALELLKDITNTCIIENDINNEDGLEKSIEKLNKKLVVDELTGAYNRRFINERLPVDIFFAAMNKTKLSLIMADVDNFKQINDNNNSHMAGDLILKEVSKIMISSIRKNIDWVARFGGDEFLICLNGANEAASARIAEAIRLSTEKTAIEYQGNTVKTTLSIGVYTLDGEDIKAEELLRRVDMNLYEAKKLGKNTIVCDIKTT